MLTTENEKAPARKIAVIGSGFVGASIAYALVIRNLADKVVLIDVRPEVALGEAIDIRHGIASMGTAQVCAGDYSDCADCDLIVITAGRNRRPNEVRLDLIADNLKIAKGVTDEIKKYYTKGVIMVVANPVDVITYNISKWMGLPEGMVFGTGCMLDTSRLIALIADCFGVCSADVKGTIIGEHGESQVVAWSRMTVAGIPVEQYCTENNIAFSDEDKKQAENDVRLMGAKIIANKGRTHFGIATSVCYLADAVLNDRRIIESVSSILHGQYGISDVALSVPSIVGAGGVRETIIQQFSQQETALLEKSALALKNTIADTEK